MISQFFIDRPRFAMVIAIVTVILGALALTQIAVSQYPRITPPEVQVSASYPGASADVVASSIAAPIEDQVNGVENMLYMSSTSTDTGSYSLTVTFAVGTDPAIAQVNVQNRIALATPRLPSTVIQNGVSVRTRSTSILLGMAVSSPGGSHDAIFLSNFATLNIRDALTRVPGVGDASVYGPTYSMRIWMDPDRMQALDITSADLMDAVRSQNAQASAGQIGAPPSLPTQQLQLSVVATGRLASAEAFGDIIVKTNANGAIVRLRDVARVELGAQTYDTRSELNGRPSATVVVYQAPEANALAVSRAVRAELARLAASFPEDITATVVFDTTSFVSETLREIAITLGITILLVVGVTYLFLQDWRATLVPTLTIPVSLVGTFAVLYAFGYSANTITLFALVLAIGLVVDDAIIVVENVQRVMEADARLSPREATSAAMRQITGPIIASTLVLAAVFVPVALLPGITGQLYRQFSVTLSVAVLLSGVNALTLSPALSALLLRRPEEPSFSGFRLFNQGLERLRQGYANVARRLATRFVVTSVFVLATLGASALLLRLLPTGFIPPEDQGYLFVNLQLPNAASLERTTRVIDQATAAVRETPGVANAISIAGSSMVGGAGSNAGMIIVALAPWSERTTPETRIDGIIGRLRNRFAAMPGATIAVFNPPAIPGLGATGGFDLRLQAQAGQRPQDLAEALRGFLTATRADPRVAGLFSTFTADVPHAFLDLDRARAELFKVPPGDVFQALQAHLGSQYVDDFSYLNRVFQVRVQDEPQFRNDTGDIERLHVRSRGGELLPIQAIAKVTTTFGPSSIGRYNLFPSATINGQAAPGTSTGAALAAMEELASQRLPSGYGYAWTGLALQERQASGQLFIVIGLAIGFAYLFLTAQFESWSVPLPVMLSVPIAVVGALATLLLVGIEINIYVQIGLVLLVGLAAKNAILIVAFAKERREAGMTPLDAAVAGTSERIRPVLMTATAFIIGVAPLVVATGAGAGSRRSIGTTVFGGMLTGTLLGILLVPMLFVLVQTIRERLKARLTAIGSK